MSVPKTLSATPQNRVLNIQPVADSLKAVSEEAQLNAQQKMSKYTVLTIVQLVTCVLYFDVGLWWRICRQFVYQVINQLLIRVNGKFKKLKYQ